MLHPLCLLVPTLALAGFLGCGGGHAYQPPLDLPSTDLASIEVLSVRAQYSPNDNSRLKLRVFDYEASCPDERPRPSSSAYRGAVLIGRRDASKQIEVPAERRILLHFSDNQQTATRAQINCSVAIWFEPEADRDYVLHYRNAEHRCSAAVMDAVTAKPVQVHAAGACPSDTATAKR